MDSFKSSCIGVIIGFAVVANSRAAVYISDDFSTFANGNLVGQNSWAQGPGASATLPLQVASGLVVIPGAQAADNQDAYKNVGAGIPQPGSGTTTVYVALSLAVQSAPGVPPFASPSYFLALTTAIGGGGFANFRLTAEDNGGGTYILGARVTGQGTDPFTFGGGALTYGVTNEIVIEADMSQGGNSSMRVFVNPINLLSPYLTHPMGVGATDPTGIGSLNISQFASATVGNVGATIDHLIVADTFGEVIPEPSTVVLVGMSLVGMLALRRRQ
jgi:hypothetical protein